MVITCNRRHYANPQVRMVSFHRGERALEIRVIAADDGLLVLVCPSAGNDVRSQIHIRLLLAEVIHLDCLQMGGFGNWIYQPLMGRRRQDSSLYDRQLCGVDFAKRLEVLTLTLW